MNQTAMQNSHYLLLVRLDNGSAITEAYGEHVVKFAIDHLQLCLDRHLNVADMRRMGCDEIELLVTSTSTDPALLEALVDELSTELSLETFHYGGEQIVLAVSAGYAIPQAENWGNHRQEARRRLAGAITPADLPGPHSVKDQKRYRNDMALAAMVLDHIMRGKGSFARKPVYQLRDSAEVSHSEVQLRLHDGQGGTFACDEAIRAFERLGMSYLLDKLIVSQALDELMDDPFLRLSVGISTRSLSLDLQGESAAWTELLTRLRCNHDLARRLIIEVQDTTPIACMAGAAAFVRKLRALGVSIAIAGFGSGPTSIRQLIELRPDIVKLDSDALTAGDMPGGNPAVMEHLIVLAHALADRVVLDGVEISAPAKTEREDSLDWSMPDDSASGDCDIRENGVVHDLVAHRNAQSAVILRSAAC